MTFEIIKVENGTTPSKEKIWLKATEAFNTKGYALVDRTFDKDGNVSNEFKHIYIFPEIKLKKDQYVIVITGKGTNDTPSFTDTKEQYYRLYWGAESCVWNDNGGDSATLISYVVVNSKKVPAVVKR